MPLDLVSTILRHLLLRKQERDRIAQNTASVGTQTEQWRGDIPERHDEGYPSDIDLQPETTSAPQSAVLFDDAEVGVDAVQEHTDYDEQAVRGNTYIQFDVEEESDYTRGPARIVPGFDGVNECATLLLTYSLSNAIKNAVQVQKLFVREQEHSERQLAEIDRSRFARQPSGSTCLYVRRQRLEGSLAVRGRALLRVQQNVTRILAEAFEEARLVPKDPQSELPIESFDLDQEYARACQEIQEGADDQVDPGILEEGDEYLRARAQTSTPEEVARHEIATALQMAEERLNVAQYRFEHKDQERDQDKRAQWEAQLRGEESRDASKEEFDLRWVVLNQEITRELIEAEKEYMQARTQAAQAAIDFDHRPDYFVFAGSAEDGGFGYDVSDETRTDHARTDQRLNDWVDTLAEDADPQVEEHSDVREWPFRDVDPSDSCSVVCDQPGRRQKILEWQQTCREIAHKF
ncbi:uncharacterized protein MYCFIDRAFT_213533 [Pseudocercospora fijiensis CIRAD86]|uniref:Uncharacterized protein n=1 Tax=Pseudocercospora fijiensis (strain CIRAD86) TaxID=383855 RepID=N1Q8B4_PSEFD|nr:uncharacterized protein MYCFIDRAFT_213533 [Pseudocercospora fijiensis CIRAD86]EME89120.1 hypothetical protein MYCFIDRAFT_213533 [Pseudocercospora fijiensis CIRAD86]